MTLHLTGSHYFTALYTRVSPSTLTLARNTVSDCRLMIFDQPFVLNQLASRVRANKNRKKTVLRRPLSTSPEPFFFQASKRAAQVNSGIFRNNFQTKLRRFIRSRRTVFVSGKVSGTPAIYIASESPLKHGTGRSTALQRRDNFIMSRLCFRHKIRYFNLPFCFTIVSTA